MSIKPGMQVVTRSGGYGIVRAWADRDRTRAVVELQPRGTVLIDPQDLRDITIYAPHPFVSGHCPVCNARSIIRRQNEGEYECERRCGWWMPILCPLRPWGQGGDEAYRRLVEQYEQGWR